MSLQHFHLDGQVIAQCDDQRFVLDLSPADLKHAKVLRLVAGEHIAVVDAASDYFEVCIESFDETGMTVSIAQHLSAGTPRADIVLYQGMAKGDKMDSVARHATEIGMDVYAPVFCERSVVKLDGAKREKRRARWSEIVKSAATQSGRLRVPSVAEPTSILDPAAFEKCTHLVVCWEEASGQTIDTAIEGFRDLSADSTIGLVIGPEGGLTPAEVAFMESLPLPVTTVSLGSTILRTETAALVAVTLLVHALEVSS